MIFDTNLLNTICKLIDDPKTLINFSLACKKTRDIVRINKNDKMDQFIVNHINNFKDGDDYYHIIMNKLPNGNLHGEFSSSCSYGAIGDTYRLYYNGIILSEWYYDVSSYMIDATVSYYKCDCISELSTNYITKRMNFNEFKLESTNLDLGSDTCNKCGKYITIQRNTLSS